MIDEQTFKDTLRLFASGITVINWQSENKIDGITVSAFCSVSLNPPLVLFCIDKSAYSYETICAQTQFAINVLSAQQSDIAYQFAGGDRSNLTEIINCDNAFALPAIHEARATLFVRIKERITQGDHDIFIAQVEDSIIKTQLAPLLYFDGKIHAQG